MAETRKQTDTCRYYIDNSFIRDGYGKELGPYAIAVYNAIAVHANQDQEAWPSHGTIASLTGMSARQVMREVEALAEYNVISVVSRAAERKPALITLLDKSEWKPIEHMTDSHMLDDEHMTDSQQTDSLKTHSHMTYDTQSYEHMTHSHTNRTNKTEPKNRINNSGEPQELKNKSSPLSPETEAELALFQKINENRTAKGMSEAKRFQTTQQKTKCNQEYARLGQAEFMKCIDYWMTQGIIAGGDLIIRLSKWNKNGATNGHHRSPQTEPRVTEPEAGTWAARRAAKLKAQAAS